MYFFCLQQVYCSANSNGVVKKNVGVSENFCACSKLFFRTSVLHRFPVITDDYRRSLAFTQCSSGAIPGTMGDLQRFLKRQKTLTRTSWCDGSFTIRSRADLPCLYVTHSLAIKQILENTLKVWLGYTLGILKCDEGIILWSCEKCWRPMIAKNTFTLKIASCPILNSMPLLKPQVLV